MGVTFPGESDEYRAARDELLDRARPPAADGERLPSWGDVIRHFWGSELLYAPTEPGQDPRHVGTIEPLWNLYDLTPEGRGSDWEEQLTYG
jgi:predicted dithiol-disulfide oxidoreductase (DUF899 family)